MVSTVEVRGDTCIIGRLWAIFRGDKNSALRGAAKNYGFGDIGKNFEVFAENSQVFGRGDGVFGRVGEVLADYLRVFARDD